MFNPWKQKPVLGIGIGVGLVGAVALAARYGFRRAPRERIPDDISPAIFATRVADTSFGEMVYHISGTGDPLVFLHGIYLGANSYEWSKVYPHFTLGRQVIVPDLIGFGGSERPDIAMDASDYAETLVEFLRNTCGDRRPAIVASGLTAGLALLLASRHPEHVERLVLLLPTGLKGAGKWAATGMATLVRLPGFNRFVYRNYLSRAPFIRGWLTKFALGNPARMNEEMVRALTTCAQQPGAEHAIISPREILRSTSNPSRQCAASGQHSLARSRVRLSPLNRRGDVAKLKRAKLVTIPDCGFAPPGEASAMTTILTTELEGDLGPRARREPSARRPAFDQVNVSDLREILLRSAFPGARLVIAIDGEVIASDNFSNILLDLAVLRSLSVKVVLVRGAGYESSAGQGAGRPVDKSDGTGVPTCYAAGERGRGDPFDQPDHGGPVGGGFARRLHQRCHRPPAGILGGTDHHLRARRTRGRQSAAIDATRDRAGSPAFGFDGEGRPCGSVLMPQPSTRRGIRRQRSFISRRTPRAARPRLPRQPPVRKRLAGQEAA